MIKFNILLLVGLLNSYSSFTFANIEGDREDRTVESTEDVKREERAAELTDKQKTISEYFIQQLNNNLRTFSEEIDTKFKSELTWLQVNYSDNLQQGDEYVETIMNELRSFFGKAIDSIKEELDNTLVDNDDLNYVQEIYNNMKNNVPSIVEQATQQFKKQLCMHNELVKMNSK